MITLPKKFGERVEENVCAQDKKILLASFSFTPANETISKYNFSSFFENIAPLEGVKENVLMRKKEAFNIHVHQCWNKTKNT